MVKFIYKKILFLLIIFIFGDFFLFCEDAEECISSTSEKEIASANKAITSQEFYQGVAIFFGVIIIYMLLGMYVRLDKIATNETLNKSASFESMSSYVESLSDFYDNPNVGYPETKGNQP